MPNCYSLNRTFGTAVGAIGVVVLVAGIKSGEKIDTVEEAAALK